MLRQYPPHSTDTPRLRPGAHGPVLTHAPSSLNASHGGSVSVAALLRPTRGEVEAGSGRASCTKPDLITYIVMCLLLFCWCCSCVLHQLPARNSFFASMPYDRSLREARSSYK
uniref:Uncharacterized protein n=1 Tax=Seriola dumerili TaxID=41447 RepID=A0A3B4UJ72_SERDU